MMASTPATSLPPPPQVLLNPAHQLQQQVGQRRLQLPQLENVVVVVAAAAAGGGVTDIIFSLFASTLMKAQSSLGVPL